jgi:hypothetical protein
MKRLFLLTAVLTAVVLLLSAFCVFADDEMLAIEVTDDELIVTVTGDFGYTDWIGFYPEDHDGYQGSTIWWYVGDEGGEWTLPDDDYVVQRNTPGVFDEYGLVPGRYFVILLANDGYEPIDDMEPIYFEIKDPNAATEAPTEASTEVPTEVPTEGQSGDPTEGPGDATDAPAATEVPTEVPTEAPTEAPTAAPTDAPTEKPATAAPATEAPATDADVDAPTKAPDDSGDDKTDAKPGVNKGLIIGIVCGVIAVAAVIAVVLIVKGKKKK